MTHPADFCPISCSLDENATPSSLLLNVPDVAENYWLK